MANPEKLEAALAESAVMIRTERDVVEVAGPEAAAYLQGQLSQNVEALNPGDTAYTLLLQPQGKVDAWLRIHRIDGEVFRLDVEPGFGSTVVERLNRFKLRTKAEISGRSLAVLAVRGPDAVTAVAAVDLPPGASAVPVPSLDSDGHHDGLHSEQVEGVDVFLTETDGVDVGHALVGSGVVEAPAEILELWRIRSGRPAMGSELDASTIPAAAGVVGASVDFTKGCYVGQELVARVDSRGNNTPTRLVRLSTEPPAVPPSAGDRLSVADGEAGVVTSAVVRSDGAGFALAFVKRGVEVPGRVSVAGPNGTEPSPADIVPLRWGYAAG